MKRILFSIWILTLAASSYAQQRGFFAETGQGYIMDNPATTGLEKLGLLSVSTQSRWVGFDESPTQNFIGYDTRLISKKLDSVEIHAMPISDMSLYGQVKRVRETKEFSPHGVGLNMARDVYGPFSRVSLMPGYAYHYGLNETWTLSGGVALGITYDDLDESRLSVIDPNDPTYQSYMNSGNVRSLYLDGQVGALLYSRSFLFGYSINQIFMNSPYNSDVGRSEHELNWHHTLSMSYFYAPNTLFNVAPYINLRGVRAAPFATEAGVKVQFADRVLASVMYQHGEAAGARLGFVFRKKLIINYTYLSSTNSLSNYNRGVHEIGIKLLRTRLDAQQLNYLW